MVDFEDDDDEGLHDREMPTRSDIDNSDSVDTHPCPACRRPVYEEADVCPHCGEFIIRDRPARRLPIWAIAVLILAMIAVVILGLR